MAETWKDHLDSMRTIVRQQYKERLELIDQLEASMMITEQQPELIKKKPNVSAAVRIALLSGDHPISLTKSEIIEFVKKVDRHEDNPQLGNSIGAALTYLIKHGKITLDKQSGLYTRV